MATIKKGIKKDAKKTPVKVSEKSVKNAIKKTAPPKEAPVKAASSAPVTAGLLSGAVTAESTALDTLYITNESNIQVTLSVNAGAQGQTSDMTITLDNKIIIKNLAGDFGETALGTNIKIAGKVLRIVATIADTSQVTNFTSLTIHLKGGQENSDFPLSKTVDQEGDSADYICRIEFFKS